MESRFQTHESAIRANMNYYQALRFKLVQQALEAWAEEIKWGQILEYKKNPENSLKNLLTSS